MNRNKWMRCVSLHKCLHVHNFLNSNFSINSLSEAKKRTNWCDLIKQNKTKKQYVDIVLFLWNLFSQQAMTWIILGKFFRAAHGFSKLSYD